MWPGEVLTYARCACTCQRLSYPHALRLHRFVTRIPVLHNYGSTHHKLRSSADLIAFCLCLNVRNAIQESWRLSQTQQHDNPTLARRSRVLPALSMAASEQP
jgi:hypothetical protein